MPDDLMPEKTGEIVIEPAEFTPVDAESTRGKSWVKPVFMSASFVFMLLVVSLWYVFTARSVFLSFEPAVEHQEINGGIALKVGERYLMRPGEYHVRAKREGYRVLDQSLVIGSQQNQRFNFQLSKLPGRLFVDSKPKGANVLLNGEVIGRTPVAGFKVEAGEHSLSLTAERYLEKVMDIEVAGKDLEHRVAVELTPAWGDISIKSVPGGAEISVDNEKYGTTPASLALMQGDRLIKLSLDGYKDWQTKLPVVANQGQTLPEVRMELLEGALDIESQPGAANVMVNDVFRGQTPLTLSLKPKQQYRVQLFKPGYQAVQREISIVSGEQRSLVVPLKPIVANIRVIGRPADAQVFIDGRYRGKANRVYSLPTEKQKLEVRKEGYVSYQTYITPRQGLEQQLKVTLKTLEQAKWDAIKPVVRLGDGQQLKLFRPGPLTLGASRREAGRRANESFRKVDLSRAFYMGTREVTNQQYRQFAKLHSSGNVEGYSLDGDSQPVVKVGWEQAALYCNWLSEREGLAAAYLVEEGKVTGFKEKATGYRLPTEAEWAWAARNSKQGLYKYPWGDQLPPAEKSGNYADRSAAFIIGRIVTQYDDTYAVSAPVGSFTANQNGLYDMGGNVSEWVHDFYSTRGGLSSKVEKDPVGPDSGKYHVIRGSSWAHGSITELRLSYRDYGIDGRNDLGFRVARYVE